MSTLPRRFKATVLADGHLSLPKDLSRKRGSQLEVLVQPPTNRKQAGLDARLKRLGRSTGLARLSEEEVLRIVHEVRGVQD